MDGSQAKTDYPVVLRFEGLYPHQLAGYEAHRLRKGGDLSHVDKSRSELNQRLIGPEDWAAQSLEEIREMATDNFAAELESLEKRNRRKDIERRMVEGPKQPWRPTRHGPMREVILTVNKDWFEGKGAASGQEQKEREELFGELARVWLIKSFGDDVIHARADRDEAAYHIHAVIMPRATVEIAKPKAKVKTASATRRMLQPSKHALIEDYEEAQDSVGRWFVSLGLVRGERRAAAIRDARENGQTPPKRRYHAKTRHWRAKQELRLKAEAEAAAKKETALADREARLSRREAEAETVLAVAEGVARGDFIADESGNTPTLMAAPAEAGAAPPKRTLKELRQRSPAGLARASWFFGRAWSRLFADAREKAEAEAAENVAEAMQQIAAADEVIAEAALHLKPEKRSIVAGIRRTIPAILRRIERGLRQGKPLDPRADVKRSTSGDEEKF